MPSNGLQIDGAVRHLQAGTLSRVSTINGTDSLTCELLSMDGSYWPDLDDETYFTDAAVVLFGGEVRTAPASGASGRGSRPVKTLLTALDFSDVLDRRLVSLTLGAVSLKSALTSFVALFSGDGMTLDAAQATGPTIEAVTYTRVRGRQILDELAVKTGYLWAEDYAKALRMWAPGDIAAPVDVNEGDICLGDVTVEPTRANYATKIYATYFEPATKAYGFFNGGTNFIDQELIPIGSTTYKMVTVLSGAQNEVVIGTLLDDSLNHLIGAIVIDAGIGSDYSAGQVGNGSVTATFQGTGVIRVTALTAGAAGNDIPVGFVGSSGASWTTEGGGGIDRLALGSDRTQATVTSGSGSWEDEVTCPDTIADQPSAQTYADGVRDTRGASPRAVKYKTLTAGLKKGQAQHIKVSWRNIDADCLITSVTLRNPIVNGVPSGFRLEYDIEAIEGTAYPGSFQDTYRKWDGAAVAVGA